MNHPDSRMVCVDPFTGSVEHTADQTEGLYSRFCHNIELTGRNKQVEVLKGTSQEVLPHLVSTKRSFDLCYIDGSHRAANVLFDAVLAWQMIKPGGLIIFDDYLWPIYQDQPLLNPKLGIDSFVNCHLDQLRYLGCSTGPQQAFQKRMTAA
jgi:predicted O-methyltransferase YrrM